MFQDILHTLARVGLKSRDVRVYLACLHFHEGLYVHEIVDQTHIKRSTVDVTLERLIDAGYMTKVKVGGRYKYFAENPETILFAREEALEDFRSILPMLSKLKSSKGETEIRFFEGRKGVEQIYDDMLLKLKFAEGESRQIVSFASGLDMMKLFPDMQKRFIDKRIQMGIWYRSVVPESSTKVSQYSRRMRIVS